MAKTKDRLKTVHGIDTERPQLYHYSYVKEDMICNGDAYHSTEWYMQCNIVRAQKALEDARFEAKHSYEDLLEAKKNYRFACEKDLPKGEERDRYIASFKNSYEIIRDDWKTKATDVILKRSKYKVVMGAYNKFVKLFDKNLRTQTLRCNWEDKKKSGFFSCKEARNLYDKIILKANKHPEERVNISVKIKNVAEMNVKQCNHGWLLTVVYPQVYEGLTDVYTNVRAALVDGLNDIYRLYGKSAFAASDSNGNKLISLEV